MTIGELSAQSGLPASTIRYWEKIGVLPKTTRAGGQRRYGPDAAGRLAVLKLAQSCGFRLEEMRHLLHGFGAGVTPPRRWQELARAKQQELDEQIARLKAMRRLVGRVLECRCLDLPDCGRIAATVMKSVSPYDQAPGTTPQRRNCVLSRVRSPELTRRLPGETPEYAREAGGIFEPD